MTDRQPTEQPAWLQALAATLGEALPRLHGTSPDPLVGELVEALAVALAEGQLDIPVPSTRHRRALAASPLCTEPHGPLALEGDRLLWRRWQRQREGVLQALIARAQRRLQPAAEAAPIDGLDGDQQRAVSAVLRYGLVLLEGGPGTGKTSTVARMLAAVCEARTPTRVLEVGAGCGYQAAVMAQFMREVHAIERIRGLYDMARENLRQLRLSTRVRLVYGDGMLGQPNAAPFDAIVVAAAGLSIPQALLDQLAPHGRLIAPEGGSQQRLVLIERTGVQHWKRTELEAVRFVPLRAGIQS